MAVPSMSALLKDLPRNHLSSTSSPSKIPKAGGCGQLMQSPSTAQSTNPSECNNAGPPVSPEAPSCQNFDAVQEPPAAVNKPQEKDFRTNSHHPHYIAEHLGEPCTLGALDHLLQCDHKVITRHGEECASNCKRSLSPFVNPKSIDRPFVCMACVIRQMSSEHKEKLWSFLEDLDVVAKTTAKPDATAWIAEKASTMQDVWREIEIDQMTQRITQGRFCYAVHVDEDYREAYAALVTRMEQSAIHDPQIRSPVAKSLDEVSIKKVRTSSRIPKKPLSRCITLM